jgi:hypothetical protein
MAGTSLVWPSSFSLCVLMSEGLVMGSVWAKAAFDKRFMPCAKIERKEQKTYSLQNIWLFTVSKFPTLFELGGTTNK